MGEHTFACVFWCTCVAGDRGKRRAANMEAEVSGIDQVAKPEHLNTAPAAFGALSAHRLRTVDLSLLANE